jgi:hypothetical protein
MRIFIKTPNNATSFMGDTDILPEKGDVIKEGKEYLTVINRVFETRIRVMGGEELCVVLGCK